VDTLGSRTLSAGIPEIYIVRQICLMSGTFPGNETLQTSAIDSVSFTIISGPSTPIDVLEMVIAVAATVKCAIDTIVSVKQIIIGETP